ncbi:hypothetical protein [Streptomyces spororaveus]|uniref:Uncharacterized protein n=1 Tax=Streptomyces spororaveus TaxID=284039 RepID=A0ABQ3T323_9ACTN|nr:hypothetical protein [Streptomyces spororaveus]GHI74787.1 hypothetical protein Sspor_03480 [Streptomyces spororaveus]
MIERRPLGTGPRPTTDTAPAPGLRRRLAAEPAYPERQDPPQAAAEQPVPGTARRRLGTGPERTDR